MGIILSLMAKSVRDYISARHTMQLPNGSCIKNVINYTMKIFENIFAHKVIAVATVATLAFGGAGVALAHDNNNGEGRNGEDRAPRAIMPHVEIQINNGGHVSVRGATVTAISGNTITATTALGSTTLSWTVLTDSSTKFIASSTNTIGAIAVGDAISFQGSMHGNATTLTVDAKVVKDLSRLPAHKKAEIEKNKNKDKNKDKSH